MSEPVTTSPRRRLPDERPSIIHKFVIAGQKGYLRIGLYADTRLPGEIFITMGKKGSEIRGLLDSFSIVVSIALQYGVPLSKLCEKLSHTRFEPAGFTSNKQIPIAKSIMDYIFRYLAIKFMTPLLDEEAVNQDSEDTMGKNVHVVHRGWAVKLENSQGDYDRFTEKEDAIAFGRTLAKEETSELVIHGRDGRIQRKHSYGNDPKNVKG